MNILFLLGPNVNPQNGGVARITHTLANKFIENGHNIWYLGYRKVCEDDPDRQLYFPTAKLVSSNDNIKYLEKLLIEKSIDIVIVQHNPCREYLQMLQTCKVKHSFSIVSCFHNLVLTQVQNYAYLHEYKLRNRHLTFIYKVIKNRCVKKLLVGLYILKYRSLYKYVIDNSDISIVLSEGQKYEILKMIGRKFDNSIKIIPNCCDEKNANITDKSNEVLWVGRVDCDVKRIDFMIDVWSKIQKKHPNWILRVLGDGPALQEIKRSTVRSNINNIIFEGRVIPDAYYDRAKILCVTSSLESFSLVTIEAKMHGVVPVVQNSFPIASEIVNHGVDGLLVNPFNLNEFTETLSCLMSDEILIKKYSDCAMLSSRIYLPERIISMWEELFKTYC